MNNDYYTIDVAGYTDWLTSTGQSLPKRMPADGEVVLWKASFRRTWEPLKAYDWLNRVERSDRSELELPFAFLKRST